MSWPAAESSLNEAIMATFGVTVRVKATGDVITGVLDQPYASDNEYGVPVNTADVELLVHDADVSRVAIGSPLVIQGVTYTAIDRQPGHDGLTRLRLREYRDA